MSYAPSPVPHGLPSPLRSWLAQELRRIANALASVDNIRLPELGAEPDKYADGMIVYADGSSWDPGSGEGFYGREGGAWVKL